MRTVKEVLALVEELTELEDTDLFLTQEHFNLLNKLDEDEIFRCACCGEMVSYNDLEHWTSDFSDLEHGLLCSYCYESNMGYDL